MATGGASPDSFVGGGGDFFVKAADAIAASIPQAQRQTIEGQTHMVDPKRWLRCWNGSSEHDVAAVGSTTDRVRASSRIWASKALNASKIV